MNVNVQIKPFGENGKNDEESIKEQIKKLRSVGKTFEADKLQTTLEAKLALTKRLGKNGIPRTLLIQANKEKNKQGRDVAEFYRLLHLAVNFIVENYLPVDNFFIGTTPGEVLSLKGDKNMDRIVFIKCKEYIKIKIEEEGGDIKEQSNN